MSENRSIWIGFDPREVPAFAVARQSIKRRLTQPIPINGLVLHILRSGGLYWRDHKVVDGKLFDVISEAPMSTEFAISRFLVPHLAKTGWAAFLDADMLALTNMVRVFEQVDSQYAMMCVKHSHDPKNDTKMDGQVQTKYPRKNWSSMMLFNCDHPANKALTLDVINTLPGRDLHRFCWLDDSEIGELDASWNWLVGHSPEEINPDIVHFTNGGPWLPEYENVPYAEEWRKELSLWAV